MLNIVYFTIFDSRYKFDACISTNRNMILTILFKLNACISKNNALFSNNNVNVILNVYIRISENFQIDAKFSVKIL